MGYRPRRYFLREVFTLGDLRRLDANAGWVLLFATAFPEYRECLRDGRLGAVYRRLDAASALNRTA